MQSMGPIIMGTLSFGENGNVLNSGSHFRKCCKRIVISWRQRGQGQRQKERVSLLCHLVLVVTTMGMVVGADGLSVATTTMPIMPLTTSTGIVMSRKLHMGSVMTRTRRISSITNSSVGSTHSICLRVNHSQSGGGKAHTGASGTSLDLSLRGGDTASAAATPGAFSSCIMQILNAATGAPTRLFNTLLITLVASTLALQLWQPGLSPNEPGDISVNLYEDKDATKKDTGGRSLQLRFLPVFWLLRCADWLQGPYFYEVYASKVFNGGAASPSLVSKLFLTGFASTALFGPAVGRFADSHGRKRGTLVFTLLYSLGALSTRSMLLWILFMGRVLSGIGTSLLFSAPEAWLVGEAQSEEKERYLGETFGLAYAGDSIVAILAGQLAALAASNSGPSGPFELSVGFLAMGAFLASILWKENVAAQTTDGAEGQKATIRDALKLIRSDSKIALVGAVQSLFEAAMYIFVLQWPPAVRSAVTKVYGPDAVTPFGAIFSCFMASCLFGSRVFGKLVSSSSKNDEKNSKTITYAASIMLVLSTLAMGTASTFVLRSAQVTKLSPSPTVFLCSIISAFFVFESCVGFYFPCIGTLRSEYVPDSHRSVIMNLFGIPLNVLVVSVFLSIQSLGVSGALCVSAAALSVGTLCMLRLNSMVK